MVGVAILSTRRSFLRTSSMVVGSGVAVLLSAACGGTTSATVASSATSSTAAPTVASAPASSSSSVAPLSTTAAAPTTSSAAGTAATSTTAAATATATTAAVVKSATAQTFTYWDWWDPVSNPTFAAWFKYARAAWAQQYPQVALDIVTIPAAGIDDYPNKFIAAVAGNDTPDALHMSVAYARDLWDKGTLLDISSMVARTPSIAADQFIPAAAFYNQADGKIFGTPVEGPSGYGIAYNVAHFQEIGATPTWETTSAWSWQTFADTAAKLVQKDSSGVTRIGYLDSTPSLEYFCEWAVHAGRDLLRAGLEVGAVRSAARRGCFAVHPRPHGSLCHQRSAPQGRHELAVLLSGPYLHDADGAVPHQQRTHRGADPAMGPHALPEGAGRRRAGDRHLRQHGFRAEGRARPRTWRSTGWPSIRVPRCRRNGRRWPRCPVRAKTSTPAPNGRRRSPAFRRISVCSISRSCRPLALTLTSA